MKHFEGQNPSLVAQKFNFKSIKQIKKVLESAPHIFC